MKTKLLYMMAAWTLGVTAAGAQLPPPAEMRQGISLGTGVVPGANGPEIWFGSKLGARSA
jgi:hypothetical protein